MKRIILIVLSLWCVVIAASAKLPVQVKKSTAFLFLRDSNRVLIPSGTGFFIQVNAQQNNDTVRFGYLVTSKHALRMMNGTLSESLYVRIDRKDGLSDTLLVPLTVNGVRRYAVHTDSTVDLAVLPAFPDAARYDFLFTPYAMIAPEDFVNRFGIVEGDEVFYTGMLASQPGVLKNAPAVRTATFLQFSDEKYRTLAGWTEGYLLDASFTPGMSGAPLYYYAPADSISGRPSATFLLAGIVSGAFPNNTTNGQFLIVTPAYKLFEVLNQPFLTEERNKEFLKLRK